MTDVGFGGGALGDVFDAAGGDLVNALSFFTSRKRRTSRMFEGPETTASTRLPPEPISMFKRLYHRGNVRLHLPAFLQLQETVAPPEGLYKHPDFDILAMESGEDTE